MKNLQTTAGRSSKTLTHDKLAFADAISQIFALFELNYHNQYHKAISNEDKEKSAKRLWMNSLDHFSIEVITSAAEKIIKTSQFLPTLSLMLDSCQDIVVGKSCPDALSAYEEACASSYPKNENNWSHPAVYFAGSRTGWERLETQAESQTLPIFKQYFKQVKAEIAQGQEFIIPKTVVTPQIESTGNIVSKDDMEPYLNSIRKILDS